MREHACKLAKLEALQKAIGNAERVTGRRAAANAFIVWLGIT